MAHIGILLTSAPFQSGNWETAINLADSALDKGHSLSFFLYADGVLNPLRRQFSPLPNDGLPYKRFMTLSARGARILICGTGAMMRGLGVGDYIEAVVIGGLPDFALLLLEADRLVCL